MKLSPRNVALVLGAVVLVGLIPNTLSLQQPRTENITVSAHNGNAQPLVLPTLPVAAPDNYPPQNVTDEIEKREQRTPSLETSTTPRPYESLELYIHLPPDAAKYQPLRVLFVLHGMGGRGAAFSQSLIAETDKNHWLVIAPTIPYTDYMNPTTLLIEDIRYTGMLADMMTHLPKKLGLKLHKHALVYGFSRGAQLAHRFGIFYPEHVESVAAISAGSFTLPADRRNNNAADSPLRMPYGISDLELYLGHVLNSEDLKKVSFLIEVGENDNAPDDVPRQFDPYSGRNRVERARAFQSALLSDGVSARLLIFPSTGHQLTNDMIKSALLFLRDEELAKKLND